MHVEQSPDDVNQPASQSAVIPPRTLSGIEEACHNVLLLF